MNGGAWCPKHMVSRNLNEYLQLDLLSMHSVTSIKTQGRFGRGQGAEFTEAFVVEYWRPSFGTKWKRWRNIQGKEVSVQLAVILKRLEWAWKMEKVLSVYCCWEIGFIFICCFESIFFQLRFIYTSKISLTQNEKRRDLKREKRSYIHREHEWIEQIRSTTAESSQHNRQLINI